MDADFWHQKWAAGETAFHKSEANPLLTGNFDKLNMAEGCRIFLPLCGKTHDLAWLLGRGYRVVGVELSELAINELFNELCVVPEIVKAGEVAHYSAKNIDIFVGDFFHVSADLLGAVDAIYDRAALVALPAAMRKEYISHLTAITDSAPQLLITYVYDQQLIDGPPFSVSDAEVRQHYSAVYKLKPVERESIEKGLKGKVDSTETVWLLEKLTR